MDHQHRQQTPRRRKPTQFESFKETYLPAVIICAAFLLIIVFLIGALATFIQRNNLEEESDTYISSKVDYDQLSEEAARLMTEASVYAADYDYESAIATLDRFSGDINDFPNLASRRQEYVTAKDNLVLWEDNSQVLNLSFHHLIADPERAFKDQTYGNSYNKNFVTID